MAKQIPNEFTSWKLTDNETLEGSIFTITQLQVLQNQLSMCAFEKNSIEYDPERPQEFLKQEAYKRGQIDILRYLLASSEAAALALYPTDVTELTNSL